MLYMNSRMLAKLLSFRPTRAVSNSCTMANPISNLAHIDVKTNNPFNLFNDWKAQAFKCLPSCQSPNIMNLATSSRDGCVSNRHVVVLENQDDGFVILTCRKSAKAKDISENPNVSATFLWIYCANDRNILQQVRVTGVIEELDVESSKKIFDGTPPFRKITYYIGQQDEEVDWDEMKKKHDAVLGEVENGRVLEMPTDAIVYKLTPSTMEFYYSHDNFIADRVIFTKKDSTWSYKHLAP